MAGILWSAHSTSAATLISPAVSELSIAKLGLASEHSALLREHCIVYAGNLISIRPL